MSGHRKMEWTKWNSATGNQRLLCPHFTETWLRHNIPHQAIALEGRTVRHADTTQDSDNIIDAWFSNLVRVDGQYFLDILQTYYFIGLYTNMCMNNCFRLFHFILFLF